MNLKSILNNFFYKKNETFLIKVIFFPLELLSYFYLLVILLRNFFYKSGIFSEKKLDSFVISVGNLTTGGSGKTPVVIAISEYLKNRGYSVGIVARSYRSGTNENFCLYHDNIFYSASLYGDEPVLLKKKLNKIPVFAGKNKTETALLLEKAFRPDVIVVDDGFSHRGLARDIDIVMVDAESGFGNGYLLPRGPMREPVRAIKRADVILFKVINKENSRLEVKKILPESLPVFEAKIQMESIRSILDESIDIDLNKKFIAFCGIGNAESFKKLLIENGLKPMDFIEFEDHFSYNQSIIRQIDECAIKNQTEFALCTEKDAVKLKEILDKIKTKTLFCYVSINAVIDKNFYDFIEKEIKLYENKRGKKGSFS
jgi:tetraacyldisaccharide 4'-kinase